MKVLSWEDWWTVNQAVYKGKISTPKTEAGLRQIPLSTDAWKLQMEWKGKAEEVGPDCLVFSTKVSTALCPNRERCSRRASAWEFRTSRGLPAGGRTRPTQWGFSASARSADRATADKQSDRTADGSLERRHDAQRVHAGAGRIGTRGGRKVSKGLFTRSA